MKAKCKMFTIAAIALLFLLMGTEGFAASISHIYGSHDLKTESIFDGDEGSLDLHGIEAVKFPHSTLNLPHVPASVILNGRGYSRSGISVGKKRIIVPVVLSALLPGLGELYLYGGTGDISILARVPLFIVAEHYFWYGYYYNHRKGKYYKTYYEFYANKHWSLERFLIQHPCCDNLGGCTDCNDYNHNCEGEFNYFLFTPRNVDEEEYYENIGKYDAFVYGWDDWNDQPDDYRTPHRNYYWELRKRSDYYLLKGDNNIMYLLVNRVVSMIDAGWLAYRINRGYDVDKGWSIDIKSIRLTPSIIVGYRF